jgi:putative component of membrane protein insertase Oxa1/YidC/SpoIIIJ protein YidD
MSQSWTDFLKSAATCVGVSARALVLSSFVLVTRPALAGLHLDDGGLIPALVTRTEISPTDAQYITSQQRPVAESSTSPGVSFYQKFAAQSLSSRCRWAPSDSQHARLTSARCGPLVSLLLTSARFLNESEAHAIGRPFVADDGRLSFFDLEEDCWLTPID